MSRSIQGPNARLLDLERRVTPPLPMGEGWGEGSEVADKALPSPQPSPRGRGGVTKRFAPWGTAVVIFALSLLVRLPDLDKFATIDESRWIQRGADFWTSLRKGDAPGTFLIGHPGVTTMWLVGLGMGRERVERMATRPGLEDVTRRDGYLDALVSARRAFVILGAGLLALITLLTWRLAGPG